MRGNLWGNKLKAILKTYLVAETRFIEMFYGFLIDNLK